MVTTKNLDRTLMVGSCLAQTEISPDKAVIIGTWSIGEFDTADLQWLCAHIVSIQGVTTFSGVTRISKTGSTVTTTMPFFTADSLGSIITWAESKRQAVITAVNSSTGATVTTVGTQNPANTDESNDFFSTTPLTPFLINDAIGGLACGVQTSRADLMDMPGGLSTAMISATATGVYRLNPSTSRIYSGPDVVSIVATNNTRNFNLQVGVTAVWRYCRHGP